MNQSSKKILNSFVSTSTAFLLVCAALGFAGQIHWFPDILSHFVFQYLIGGIALSILCMPLKRWKTCAVLVIFSAACLLQILMSASTPPTSAGNGFHFAVYNRNTGPLQHDHVLKWIEDNNFDVVALQEANPSLSHAVQILQAEYPHQIHKPRTDAFGTIILSRYPFLNTEEFSFENQPYANLYFNIQIQPEDFSKPLSLYIAHTIPPIGAVASGQRNYEFSHIAKKIAADKNPVLFAGDFNITPYSQYFRKLLHDSGLKNFRSGLFPTPTWPVSGVPWLMQIPIDHILVSPALTMDEKIRYKLPGSDHYPVAARIYETKGD